MRKKLTKDEMSDAADRVARCIVEGFSLEDMAQFMIDFELYGRGMAESFGPGLLQMTEAELVARIMGNEMLGTEDCETLDEARIAIRNALEEGEE